MTAVTMVSDDESGLVLTPGVLVHLDDSSIDIEIERDCSFGAPAGAAAGAVIVHSTPPELILVVPKPGESGLHLRLNRVRHREG